MQRGAIFYLLLVLPLLGQAATPRTLQADIPATAVQALSIITGVGQVSITPSGDDAVHVQVVLRPKSREFLWFFHWMSSGSDRDVSRITLRQERNTTKPVTDNSLELSLNYPSGLDNGDVKEDWTVQVPARLALRLDTKVGQASIDGVAGGVKVQMNVGEIDLDIPHGPISATVNVGQIRAVSASSRPGNISLSSTIGEAALFVNGKSVRAGGRHSGLGRRISLAGSGPDSMQLSVNVGEVDLRINSPLPPNSKS